MELREKVRRLEQLKHLRREVDALSQRIAELEQASAGGSGRIAGMPQCPKGGGYAGEYGEKLAGLRAMLEARRLRCMEELGQLYAFIDDIPDSFLRQIFTCRYIDGDTWQRVAFRVGNTDEQIPRKLHNRYLERADL